MKHGAEVKLCRQEGCKNQAKKGGVYIRHGAKVAKAKHCSREGCMNQVQKGGVCYRHGAKRYECSSEGCTNQSVRGGVCKRHGAYRNTIDDSTAFGTAFEQTTVAQPNDHASGASITGQGERGVVTEQRRRGVPGEVAILCKEKV